LEESEMTKNIGTPDKWIRIIVGLFLISLIFWGPETLWGLIGLIPIVTVFINFCPIYGLLGLSTNKAKQKPA
jgi:hypothetical protein